MEFKFKKAMVTRGSRIHWQSPGRRTFKRKQKVVCVGDFSAGKEENIMPKT